MLVEESQMVLPALYIIKQKGVTPTNVLITELEKLLQPEGEDLEILTNRTDTKFSQKVRNLVSHDDRNGMDRYINRVSKGKYVLTSPGAEFLEANMETLEYLFSGRLSREDQLKISENMEQAKEKGKKILVYQEDESVQEGELVQRNSTVRKRSAKLRKAAIDYYKNKDGELRCAACGFSFEDAYGELGEDFIEIHHEKPLSQYEEEALNTYISEAVQKMKPVCSNCHRMIHRKRNQVLTIEQLKEIIESR